MTINGRILAIDYGQKRVGLALSDSMQIIAQPYRTLECKTEEELRNEIQAIVKAEKVVTVLVGLPKRLDGSLGEMGQNAKALAGKLRDMLEVKVKLWDERFSTHAAERSLLEADMRRAKRKKVIDQTAATWMLQGYLDSLQYK